MLHIRAALAGAALVLSGCPPAAQDAVLTSHDGAIRLEGTLSGYDGEFYRLETGFGELTLDASAVTCDGPGCPDLMAWVPSVRLSGAPEMGRVLLPALIEAHAARSGLIARREIVSDTEFAYELRDDGTGAPVLRLGFHLTSSDEGFADLIADAADIALSLREITEVEVARGREAGIGDLSAPSLSQVVALDATVPLVARGNPVTRLDWAALSKLLAEGGDWTLLGGPAAPVTLHRLDPPDPLLPVSAPAQVHPTAEALADAVTRDPRALGLGRFSDTGGLRPLPLVGSCGFQIAADAATIRAEDHPLTAPLFLYRTATRPPKPLREFLAFLLSPAAQPVIRRAGFVDQAVAEQPIDAQGRRLAQAILAAGGETGLADLQEMAGHLSAGRRLSPTFRFRGGTAELDAGSRTAVQILARALMTGALDGSRIEFVGFSDGTGHAAENRRLALARAEAALDAVRRAAPALDPGAVTFSASSYGEALPILCDADPWGAAINRRVEVWRFQR